MNAVSLLLVAAGGALGSVLRALASRAVPSTSMPWGTIAVNIAGSLLIGWLMARFTGAPSPDLRAHSFWVAGVCGGFTTFSAFSWQNFEQLHRGQWLAAIANIVVSLFVCLLATWLGWRIAR